MFFQIKNADVGYQSPLIQDVNAELDEGEICLIIGDNGVGKTTLIKSILNQIPLLSGEIIIDNQPIVNLSAKEIAAKIAVVFSKSEIPENYTVIDLVSLGKYIHYPYYFELNKIDKEEVTNIIQELGLSKYQDFPLSKLSDGNLQKAFIGRALAQNSPMIILDEPTTHLDEKNKIATLHLLKNLAKNHGKTILFSSHDWRIAKIFADKIWYINNKKLHSGLAEDVLSSHPELMEFNNFVQNSNFVLPKISAPQSQRDLLLTVLQKNFDRDLSNLQINYSDSIWTVHNGNSLQKTTTFAEILEILRNCD